ncbi:hypothetical protein ACH4F6_39015 [Streptomyces sp. NPDC017936]|uniref:hypothetical protein n=1 Tax=Streptomyces sp. NPDC017936 TaxID=3365016 RepID=UPI0037BD8749
MFITDRLEAIQYDGTNGEHIATEFLSNTTVASDDGQILRLVDGTNDPEIALDNWVIRRALGGGLYMYLGTYPDADFKARYAPLP